VLPHDGRLVAMGPQGRLPRTAQAAPRTAVEATFATPSPRRNGVVYAEDMRSAASKLLAIESRVARVRDRLHQRGELDDELDASLERYFAELAQDPELQIGMLDIGQAGTMGGMWVGQAAQVTGTDAANDVVADFTGTVETLFTTPSIAVPVLAAHSITLGSTFKIQAEGVWVLSATVHAQTAASVRIGIGIDNVVGDLSIDPVPTSRTLDVALSISAGADTVPMRVSSDPIVVTRNMALDPTLGIVRLLMSNNAGAGAADAAVLVALTQLRIKRLGNIPRASSGAMG